MAIIKEDLIDKKFKKPKASESEAEPKFIRVYPIEKEKDYRGKITGFEKKSNGMIVKAEITDLENPDICYGTVSGYLNYEYVEGDLTDSFMETFDIRNSFREALDKEAVVSIEFNESNGYRYPNIVWFS